MLSPHQNGKVVGALMALAGMVVVLPTVLFIAATAPGSAPSVFVMIFRPA